MSRCSNTNLIGALNAKQLDPALFKSGGQEAGPAAAAFLQ